MKYSMEKRQEVTLLLTLETPEISWLLGVLREAKEPISAFPEHEAFKANLSRMLEEALL